MHIPLEAFKLKLKTPRTVNCCIDDVNVSCDVDGSGDDDDSDDNKGSGILNLTIIKIYIIFYSHEMFFWKPSIT